MLSVVTAVLLVGLLAAQGFALTIPPLPGDPHWDPNTRTYTLSGDVYDRILISEGMLTLDGNGYSVIPPSPYNGVTIVGKVGVVVKNLKVVGVPTAYGVVLSSNANGCEVLDNTISNCLVGIYLYGDHDNIVSGNTVFGNTQGIGFNNASYNNILTDNIILSNNYGMYIAGVSNRITAYNNDLIANEYQVYASETTANNIYYDETDGGNYWDDWAALYDDSDGDGFLDEPRTNLPGSAEGDQLPLANMYLIRFFDDCVDAGTITATTTRPRPAARRLTSFRDKLVGAQVLIEAGDYASACDELDSALNACDGIGPPPDLVMGEDIGTLVDMIATLKTALGCE